MDPRRRSYRVVVIASDGDVRDLLRAGLVRGGYHVVGEARDGASGLRQVRDAGPDVVLVTPTVVAPAEVRAAAPDATVVALDETGPAVPAVPAAHATIAPDAAPHTLLELLARLVDERPEAASALDEPAVVAAPFGILEVDDEPELTVRAVNRVAERLVGGLVVGVPLAGVAPALAAWAARAWLDPDPSTELDLAGGHVRATLRHVGRLVVIYLLPG